MTETDTSTGRSLSRIAWRLMPKSRDRSGLPGPGDTTIASNSSMLIRDQSESLRTTTGG
ncbi:hypothetical protein O7606_07685 [Micromonospora sp. WMMD882]|uniref:hypothetical protein n=1 Tax=Micromonospora sp. WMMD882 TaxID=3015151 RepID=UPI00248B2D52|nr:hypothetical protein [Micromonospora sp. WMMD882]WBB81248.1 hypothetical protein O7606_07685 [Micromonospora sp. WMMD882]